MNKRLTRIPIDHDTQAILQALFSTATQDIALYKDADGRVYITSETTTE